MDRIDSGSSLIEAVVGISLLGLVVVGVVDAAWTNVRVAASTQQRSEGMAMLESARHVIESTPYSPCPHIDQSYSAGILTADPDPNDQMTVEIDHYEYWSEDLLAWIEFESLDELECRSSQDLAQEFAIQRIGIDIVDGRRLIVSDVQVKTRAPEI